MASIYEEADDTHHHQQLRLKRGKSTGQILANMLVVRHPSEHFPSKDEHILSSRRPPSFLSNIGCRCVPPAMIAFPFGDVGREQCLRWQIKKRVSKFSNFFDVKCTSL